MVFDLGGITHYSGDNQFPVRWDAEQSKLLTSTCYNPDRWDTYWTVPPCPFVMARLTASDDVIFGTSRLRQAWTGALLAHPLAYLMHRLSFTAWFLTGWTLNLELYHASDPSFTPLAQKQAFQAVLAAHAVLGPTVLFRTGFWLVAAIMIGALAWPRRATAAGAFAVGITASAVIYVATFFLIGVASDFRYAYWCVLASLVGAPAAIAARSQ